MPKRINLQLIALQRSIHRHLHAKGSTANLLNEDEFKNPWEVLKFGRKQLLVEFGKRDYIWYEQCSLGRNKIGKLCSKAAQNDGLQGRLANPSVCKTCILRLFDSDVTMNYVAQLSGYWNVKSLHSYKSASIQHQRRMLFTMNCSANVRAISASLSSLPSVVDIHQKESKSKRRCKKW